MFFSTYVLSKKGALAKVWLAAHWDKKLTRNDVRVIDLNQTVVQIARPQVPIALRTSGELLIGVVRIYALKVKHLLKDATDATLNLRVSNVQVIRATNKETGKEAAIAVTMDLVAGSGKAAALCEADFTDIADILKTGVTAGKSVMGRHSDPNDVLGSAWLAAEPSQLLEEQISSQGDDLSRIRAEMRAYGSRSGSSTDKTNSSSAASADKARASTALGDNVFGVVDPRDIERQLIEGAAADGNLDELLGAIPGEDPAAALQNPPEQIDDVMNIEGIGAPQDVTTTTTFNKKKKNNTLIVDTADTTLSIDDLRTLTTNTKDLVNNEPRRGPYNAAEASALSYLRTIEQQQQQQRLIRMAPYSHIPNPVLCQVFEAAISATATKAVAELEAARGIGSGVAAPTQQQQQYDADGTLLPPPIDDDYGIPQQQHQEEEEEGAVGTSNRRSNRLSGGKRHREDDHFSESALRAWKYYADTLEGSNKDNNKNNNKSSTFAVCAKGRRRIEVARLFVDTMALASHEVVSLRQDKPFADIVISSTALTNKVPATALAAMATVTAQQ